MLPWYPDCGCGHLGYGCCGCAMERPTQQISKATITGSCPLTILLPNLPSCGAAALTQGFSAALLDLARRGVIRITEETVEEGAF